MALPGDSLDSSERHAEWNDENMAVLRASGLKFETRPAVGRVETVLFREPGKPKVDFYPSTGRYRIVGAINGQIRSSGGTKNFLEWYARQTAVQS